MTPRVSKGGGATLAPATPTQSWWRTRPVLLSKMRVERPERVPPHKRVTWRCRGFLDIHVKSAFRMRSTSASRRRHWNLLGTPQR
eukprot:scaffold2469_cov239-Pinguiococcus_pyrenoidosus.AAC.12